MRGSLSSWVLLLLIGISVLAYIAYRNSQRATERDPIELASPDSPASTQNDPYYGSSQSD
jgi:hypothetical protein